MAYPYYNTPYNPATNPYNMTASAPRYEIIKVNGQNGAQALQMAPNSQALLLDETAPIVWLAMTDGAGYKTLTAYDITPAQTAEQREKSKFDVIEQRLANLEAIINGQPNTRSAKPKSSHGADSAD